MKIDDQKRVYYFIFIWAVLFGGFILLSIFLPMLHKAFSIIKFSLLVLVVCGIYWFIRNYASKDYKVRLIGPSQWFLFFFVVLAIPIIFFEILDRWSTNSGWKTGIDNFIMVIFFIANVGVILVIILSYFQRKGPKPPSK